MPAKEIKALRQAGNLEEALTMAKAELEADPKNIWAKRNISWVYYDYLKMNILAEHFDSFYSWLNKIKNLEFSADEKMLFEQLCWQIGKMAFNLLKCNPTDPQKNILLFETIRSFHFTKQSESYSFLFKAFHKLLKDTDHYLQFADWWDFKNFIPEDFQREKMPNGIEVMAIAEQAYIAYAKHLLPKQTHFGDVIFDKEKAEAFLPVLSEVVENYPQFQYPGYFNAKLLLALGEKDNMLESLLPFAKKKRNDFWVWEILAEAYSHEPEKVFACYCRALSCKSPEEMLVSLRQKMAGLLIAKKLHSEAKTEIELLIRARIEHGYKIPNEVINWQTAEWFKNAVSSKSNLGFYKKHTAIAEALLFSDVSEELVFVEFVNSDRKILNFIASETKFGYFKYDRFFTRVEVGDVLRVRFQGGSREGIHQLYTGVKVADETFKKSFLKDVSGIIKIPEGKTFGFLNDVYIHPATVSKNKFSNGIQFDGKAIKTYNKEKKQWGWKLV